MPIFVNQVEITDDEVHSEMQYHAASCVDEARHKAAQALVIRQLLLQAATEKHLLSDGVSIKAEEEAIDQLIAQEVSVPQADESSCERYYQQNLERFTDQKRGELLPFEMVVPHIRDYLHARSLKAGISQYIKLLSGKAQIAGFELEEYGSPLVQ